MAAAGFIYFPLAESRDTAMCPYCKLSLDGWEPEDDPIIEHEKRQPTCQFLKARRKQAKTQSGAPAATASRAKTRRAALHPSESESDIIPPKRQRNKAKKSETAVTLVVPEVEAEVVNENADGKENSADLTPTEAPRKEGARARREKAKNVCYSEDLLDLDGKPKPGRKAKTRTANEKLEETDTTGKSKGRRPLKRAAAAKKETSTMETTRENGVETADEAESVALTDIGESESELPLEVDMMPTPSAIDNQLPAVSETIPPFINGVPNDPKFVGKVTIEKLSAHKTSMALTNEQKSMTVEEYLRNEALSVKAEFRKKRDEAWQSVEREFEKLINWIEKHPGDDMA
ncbi:hypothetical protein SpCBS45565_g04820 [Spizellomyces sp. 'palustris']|nr:hypothetical protein SpCBS45565_g04820 [Spizellomyces sp. 'palustris']